MQGANPPFAAHSRPLIDYTTLVNVFQGCADLAPANATAPLNLAPSAARCASLHAKGLLASTTTADQATEAQKIINDFGILPEQNLVQPGYWFAYVPQSISVTYANAYGRFSVLDNLCNYSFGATDGRRSRTARGRRRGADLRHQQRHSADQRRQPDQQRGAGRAEGGPRLDAGPGPRRRALPALARDAAAMPSPARRSARRPGPRRTASPRASRTSSRRATCIASRRSSSPAATTASCRRISPRAPISASTTWSRDR